MCCLQIIYKLFTPHGSRLEERVRKTTLDSMRMKAAFVLCLAFWECEIQLKNTHKKKFFHVFFLGYVRKKRTKIKKIQLRCLCRRKKKQQKEIFKEPKWWNFWCFQEHFNECRWVFGESFAKYRHHRNLIAAKKQIKLPP